MEVLDANPTIVGEVSRTWDGKTVDPFAIGQKFEEMIRVNAARGYALKDWRMVACSYTDDAGQPMITETIVAVFAKEWRP